MTRLADMRLIPIDAACYHEIVREVFSYRHLIRMRIHLLWMTPKQSAIFLGC